MRLLSKCNVLPAVGAQIKNFNAQAQIAQPKFLISKTQAQIAQVKIKSVKRKRKLRNFF